MRNYTVYVLINVSLQEVFFGLTGNLEKIFSDMPAELAHWDLKEHHISNAVMIEEDLPHAEALSTIRTLQENALKNPQGKTILLNTAVS